MKTLTPLLLFLLFYSSLHSQIVPTKNLKYEALTIKDGLSQGLVNCMLQDRYGFMWFGTKDGLNRYDGYHFTVFRHDNRDERSIAGNFIQSLFEDSKGRLWIGTLNKGLDLFIPETENFIHFIQADTGSSGTSLTGNEAYRFSGLSSKSVWGVSEDRKGNIWVCTASGVDVITINNNVNDVQQKYSIINTNLRQFAWGINFARNGKMYLHVPGLLYKITYDQDTPGFQHLQLDSITSASFDFSSVKEKANHTFISPALQDTFNNRTWFYNGSSMVCVDDHDNKVLKVIPVTSSQAAINSAIIDSGGVILFISNYEIKELNTNTGTLTNIQLDGFSISELDRGFFYIYRDRSGTLWMATNGYGLVKHNMAAEKFNHTCKQSIAFLDPAPNNCVYVSVFPYYFTFDPQQRTFFDTVQQYQRPSFGNGWDTYGFPRLNDSRGRRLIGYAERLYCYDYATKNGMEYKLPVKVADEFAEALSEFQQQILEDRSGLIWIATREGLFQFNEVKQSWKRFMNVPGDTASITMDIVYSLCLDPRQPEKYLWVGTAGGGLNRMDMTTGKFISYTTQDGLSNNVVFGILNDDEGNLWLSTNKGLSRFDPVKKIFKNYEEEDGLQSNEFTRRAFCRLPNGLLFFGGVNGFNYFNPKDIHNNTYIPQVLITSVRIRNEPVSLKEKNSPLTAPAYLTKQIALPYSSNMITFEFASMDFSGTGKNFFQYKLEGFDEDWIQSGADHSATYTNLDPRTYTFLLKGSNSDGVWNEQPTSMQLTILPPWYMTWWFRGAVVLAVGGLLYAFYRYRLQRALELQSVRNRIAQDLHDEIGSNLSNISIFSELARNKTENGSKEATSLLKLVNDYTQDSMEAMSDIVWMINSKNDRFENILVRMQSHAAELFEAKNYQLHFSGSEDLNAVKLGMEERKNFYLIYKEALNNIAKYAECNNVWIDLNYEHGEVVMQIKDDGKGFDLNNHRNGNGLINMNKRATVLNGKFHMESFVGKGTSIKLAFKA